MRLNRTLALGASMLVLVGACSAGGGSTSAPTPTTAAPPPAATGSPAGGKPTIRIGSAGFYEAKLMGEIYAQVLEHAGYNVTRNLGLGARDVIQPALTGGQVDLLPEYIGSALQYLNKQDKDTTPADQATGDAATTAQRLQAKYQGKGITVLGQTPAQDQNGFVVRKDTADKYHLTKISDLAAVQGDLTWGLPPECETNPLCGGVLKDMYGITVPPAKMKALAACDAPIAQALQNNAIDVAELCTTQPDIARFGFVLLQDDKQSQPSDNIAPLVRDDYLAKVDAAAFRALLDGVSAKMTTDELTKLGVAINVDQKDIADVAKQWLTDNGFLK
jgi:osmoprotectant transport system substrate-binding protein